MSLQDLRLKRVYDPVALTDGKRVLVDRLWPRGLSKDKAQVDEWLKEVAPSPSLRQWFGHNPERFTAFRELYERELGDPVRQNACRQIAQWVNSGPVTLLYAAKDPVHNHALILFHAVHELVME